jgi:hypothetical protein
MIMLYYLPQSCYILILAMNSPSDVPWRGKYVTKIFPDFADVSIIHVPRLIINIIFLEDM